MPNAFGDLFKPQVYWHYTALENVPAILDSGGLDPAKNKFSALDKGGRQAIFFTGREAIYRNERDLDTTQWVRFGHSGVGLVSIKQFPILMSKNPLIESAEEHIVKHCKSNECWRVSFRRILLSEFERVDASFDNGASWKSIYPNGAAGLPPQL